MTAPPRALLHAVEARLGCAVADHRPIGGGCINAAHVLVAASGEEVFLKWNAHLPPDAFAAEADGLHALRARARGVRVPAPLGWSEPGADGPGWLALEHVAAGRPGPRFADLLAEGLASLHAPTGEPSGWTQDNWIGSLPQANTPAPWPRFWRERRLAVQLERAGADGRLDPARAPWPRVLDRVEVLLQDAPEPGLLHGDLWSGNVYADGQGVPVLVDPACYRGDGAVDLAMATLFGGFPAALGERYAECTGRPTPPPALEAAYQLYPLLVHVNLFGGSYVRAALRTAGRVLDEG